MQINGPLFDTHGQEMDYNKLDFSSRAIDTVKEQNHSYSSVYYLSLQTYQIDSYASSRRNTYCSDLLLMTDW